jgi:hypothetical protein
MSIHKRTFPSWRVGTPILSTALGLGLDPLPAADAGPVPWADAAASVNASFSTSYFSNSWWWLQRV